MMKKGCLFNAKAVYGMVILMMLVSSKMLYGTEQPAEIAILEQLEQAYPSMEHMNEILDAAPFLHEQRAVNNLLNHLRQLDKADPKHFNKRLKFRAVMERMTCQPEIAIMERLNAETDPWEKMKLIDLLKDFYSEDVFLTLIEHLDDTRNISCEQCGRRRVCDVIYQQLIFKLEVLGFVKYRYFESIYGKEQQYQAKLIAKFEEFWETNKASILQELPKREVPEHLRRLYAPPQSTSTP